MSKNIKVLVAGAAGRMGRKVVKAVLNADGMEIAGVVDPKNELLTFVDETDGGGYGVDLECRSDLERAIKEKRPGVMVDFTQPDAAFFNARMALKNGIHCVVGTTGLGKSDLATISDLCKEVDGNCLVAPNFAIGAVLMMRLCEIVAPHMGPAEIIELHHPRKADAPSGTAKMTAERISKVEGYQQAWQEFVAEDPGDVEDYVIHEANPARGKIGEGNINIHSVRLPGLVAHQEVIFGGPGQTLTIRHDSIDRTSFMPGVVLAIREIGNNPGLTVGLENFLGI